MKHEADTSGSVSLCPELQIASQEPGHGCPAGNGPGWTLPLDPHLDDIISAVLTVDSLDSTDV